MSNHFVSLFSGAGGLDIGLAHAGWECGYASDIDRFAVETLENNIDSSAQFHSTFVERADVRLIDGASILEKSGLKKGQVRLLAGGPPCQSWSSAGHQKGFEDPRGQLFSDFVRIANELDVEWIVFENVRGLLTARGPDGVPGSALEMIRLELLNAGFQTRVHLLNSADFGVPQRRVRLFIVGFRVGAALIDPVPTHSKTADGSLKQWVSLRECLSTIARPAREEIVRPSGKMATELIGIQPGSGVKSRGKRETTRPGGHWGYKQGAFIADLDLPGRTVTASGQQDWIIDDLHDLGLRRLTPRECAAIQTFPDNWLFSGSRAQKYKQIGNAVPPRMGKLIGDLILRSPQAESAVADLNSVVKLEPLEGKLSAAIQYTIKEELRNGQSRLLAPRRRTISEEFAKSLRTG